MVVLCPKCKTKLKVDEGKIAAGGSRFKCPKCGTLLLVKKPVPRMEKAFDPVKILVAHSNTSILNDILSLLGKHGYRTITASDGVEAMVKAVRELPFLAIAEVSLPKIFGFEVCKRLKGRPETKGMKFILVSSPYDKTRYKRDPESLYEADDYIEEHSISDLLVDSINALKEKGKTGKEEAVEKLREKPSPEEAVSTQEPPAVSVEQPLQTGGSEAIERAKRLARTIVSDIYLYNTPKADAAIKNNRFYADFAAEMKEGIKLYENRISQEVRSQGDFFREAINNFIESKKKALQ
ncbi:MAG: zinc-ribbon domain-containing protein [Nitrospirota bacterium]